MSLVTRHKRTPVRGTARNVVELDVATHLWASDRAEKSLDPEQEFKFSLSATQTGVFEISGDAVPQKVCYRLVEDSHCIVLEPLAVVNNLNIPLRSLKVNLPDRIRPNCLTISEYTTADNEQALIIDVITQTNVLVTIVIKLVDFVNSNISSKNYKEWCTITQPYGFDIRKPHLLYAYKHDYLVVLLKDGGLIALKRDQRFQVEPLIYNDNSYLESLGKLWRPWVHKSSFTADKELSEKTVIDVIHFQDYLLTVTINKHLRIWSISSQSLVLEKNLDEFASNPADSRAFFESTPTKLLDVFTVEIFGSQVTYLTVFLPFGRGVFKIFSVNTESFDISDLGDQYTFEVSIPPSNSIWLVGDFQLTKHNDDLQLWVLWKSNISSFVQSLVVGERTWYAVHDSNVVIEKRAMETATEFAIRRLFKSGLFSNQVIEIALLLFEKHFLEDIPDQPLYDLSLCDRVIKSVSRGISMNPKYELTLETQWSRFYSLCQEFKNQADEPLKLHLDFTSNTILVINRQQFAVVRPVADVELLAYNRSLKLDSVSHLSNVGDHLKFLSVITDFKASLASDALNRVQNETVRIFTHPTQNTDVILSSIYESQLKEYINPTNLHKLVDELTQFDNILNLVNDIIKLQLNRREVPSLAKSKLTSLGMNIVAETTRDLVQLQRETLFSLLILLLVLDFENKTLMNKLSKQIIGLMLSFELLQETFEVGFNSKDGIEVDNPISATNNLYVKALSLKFSQSFPVSQGNIVGFVTDEVLPLVSFPEFLHSVVTILISKGLSHLVYNRMLKFFDSSPVCHLLKALVLFKTHQPVKASKYFANYADEISKHHLSSTERMVFQPIEEFAVFFNPNTGKYYLNVAILFLNNLNFDQAHLFMTLLAEKRSGTGFDKKYLEHESYTLFTIAIEKLDFVVANHALPHIKDPKLRTEALTKFLYAMCKHQQINKLNDFDALKQDPQLDGLILRRAQSDDVSKSLWFYQVLYSHRLGCGNYRGASEALYEFIDKHRSTDDDKIKLTLAELYVIVVNLIGTLQEDDRWLIKHGEEEDVVGLEELKKEKQSLLRGFSRELRAEFDH